MKANMLCRAAAREFRNVKRVAARQIQQGRPLSTAEKVQGCIEFEKLNGYCNSHIRNAPFPVALADALKQFQDSCQGVAHLQRDIHARVKQCGQYPDWPIKQRREFLEGVDNTVALAATSYGLQHQAVISRPNVVPHRASIPPASHSPDRSQLLLQSLANSRRGAEPATPAFGGRPVPGNQPVGGRLQRPRSAPSVNLPPEPVGHFLSGARADTPHQASLREVAVPDASPVQEGRLGDRGVNGAGVPAVTGPANPKSGMGSDASTAEEDLWQVGELLEERRASGSAASTSATSHPSKGGVRSEGGGRLPSGLAANCRSEKYKLIIFDTETTGTKPQRCVELAALAPASGEQFEHLVKCPEGIKITEGARNTHNISDELLEESGAASFGEVGEQFVEFVERQLAPGQAPVLVAHSLTFDYNVLSTEFALCGIQWPAHWRWFDTFTLSKADDGLYGPSGMPGYRGQNNLVSFYGMAVNVNAHRAMPDVLTLAELVPRMLDDCGVGTLDNLMEDKKWQDASVCGRIIDRTPGSTGRKSREETKAEKAERKERVEQLKTQPRPPRRRRHVTRPQLPWVESGADDFIPGLPQSWAEIVAQPNVVARPLIDLSPGASKSPFTATQGKKLAAYDFATVGEVLQHYPRHYEDCRYDMEDGRLTTILGRVERCSGVSTANPLLARLPLALGVDPDRLYEVDNMEEGEPPGLPQQTVFLDLVMHGKFGKQVLEKKVSKLPVGSEVIAQGLLTKRPQDKAWNMDEKTVELTILPEDWTADDLPPPIRAVYRARLDISSEDFQKSIGKALEYVMSDAYDKRLWDFVPSHIRARYDLMSWSDALHGMHLPSTLEFQEEARQRIAFQELLLLQLTILLRRELNRLSFGIDGTHSAVMRQHTSVKELQEALPYTLTRSQEKVLQEILENLKEPLPMFRLLQGDVGCGKTVVAFLTMLAATGSGYQAALMAPTEVLAEQHFRNLSSLLEALPEDRRPTLVLLTGTTNAKAAAKREIQAGLADGSLQIVVGTHALANVPAFHKLGLAVIDEQQKFGVEQRAKLQAKASPQPHILAMTATPIPRTLFMIIDGDMDISYIEDLPPGRQRVATALVSDNPSEIAQMYEEAGKEVAAGFRAFIIYPIIDESASEKLQDVKPAILEFEKLQADEALGPGVKYGLVHGRMPGVEKLEALQKFASGETPVLVATSLIEVGMDVAEASVMIVHHADRFGLSVLHQLRGRVGRSARASKCFLVNCGGEESEEKLQLLVDEHDGMKIANADLQHRGPGDMIGKQQSGKDGLASLSAAQLKTDGHLVQKARDTAKEMVDQYGMDPRNWPPAILAALSRTRNLPKLEDAQIPATQTPV